MEKTYYVYILASQRNGTVYTGVTNDLERRVYEHKNHLIPGFTKEHNVTWLVWYADTNDIGAAIGTEKKIKNMRRRRKLELIEESNPDWTDLAADWYGQD